MLIKIAKKERDALQYVCAYGGIKVTFYSMEENEEMMLADIDCLDSTAFYLGRMMAVRVEQLEFMNK